MTPGKYLERRRAIAGLSLPALARNLMTVTGYGRRPGWSEFQMIQQMLSSAEQGYRQHSAHTLDLIRNFVPLDPDVYGRLILLDRFGEEMQAPQLCKVCACSFHDPCQLAPRRPAAALGSSTCHFVEPDLCSNCAELAAAAPVAPPYAAHLPHQPAEIRVINRAGEN